MRFIWDAKRNRYTVFADDKEVGHVFGKTGLWRAYARDRQNNIIVREGRTRKIAAQRIIAATTPQP